MKYLNEYEERSFYKFLNQFLNALIELDIKQYQIELNVKSKFRSDSNLTNCKFSQGLAAGPNTGISS